ncbi:DMT family transporter [Amycolatopsis pithecellobii]|uniref:EamA-like transporter family protein n=1 Tax=Amycolatopsis pithecellobii TaxID=664692 RepID=A0A6N7YX34_9PSEU|nr:DMT family transporter [Amycolatopsis pithecellobii]MTD52899.1 EamA-like transporter family protein [Amycolatopsis pithecellobii]
MRRSSLRRTSSVPLMVLGGALVACQSQINSRLAHGLGSGLRSGALAAVISFGSGLVLLSIIVTLSPAGRRGARQLREGLRTHRLRPVELVGGLCGAFFAACQGITVGTIGVALFIVAFTAGQAGTSLAVDYLGISPHGKQAITTPRVVAAAFAVVAVFLTAAERLASDASLLAAFFTALALVAGSLSALQQALNGRVAAAGGPLATTWNNFVVGCTALAGFLAVSFIVHGRIDGLPHTWWLYLGGLCGMTFIWLASWTVRIHGVLVLGLCTIAGQVITAELIDVLGSDSHVGVLGVVGGALTIVGVVIALRLRPPDKPIEFTTERSIGLDVLDRTSGR